MKGYRIFYGFWILVIILLLGISTISQDRSNIMVAQVQNELHSISYEQAVRIKMIHVVPGQHVDSGDVLLEVDQPGIISEIRRLETERRRLELSLEGAVGTYFSELGNAVAETNREMNRLQNLGNTVGSQPSKEIADLLASNRQRNQQLLRQLARDTSNVRQQIRSVDRQLSELEHQTSYGIAIAKFDGIIGSVNVSLDQLVPPFTTVLTLYSGQPTMIKAYMSERTVDQSMINSEVMVRSINRKYNIEGKITEVGDRVVPYPAILNPSMEGQAFGQEIFVRIPKEHQFLSGEKVNVYLLH